MELQRNIERKVAELVQRLPPMPGNISRLLLAADDPRQSDGSLLDLVKQDIIDHGNPIEYIVLRHHPSTVPERSKARALEGPRKTC